MFSSSQKWVGLKHSTFKNRSGESCDRTSFGLNDLERLVTVAHQAKEWMAAHVLKR